jgi:hypothetical protein
MQSDSLEENNLKIVIDKSLCSLLLKTYLFLDGNVNQTNIIINRETFNLMIPHFAINTYNIFLDSKILEDYIVISGNKSKYEPGERHLLCDYIIVFNYSSGETYRIHGFAQNDTIFFIDNLVNNHLCNMYTVEELLNKIHIDGIDIACIYNSLSKTENEDYANPSIRAYNCLVRANDPLYLIESWK